MSDSYAKNYHIKFNCTEMESKQLAKLAIHYKMSKTQLIKSLIKREALRVMK